MKKGDIMNRVLCSTGTLLGRPNGRDFTLLHSLVPKLHCDGLELLMYDTWYGKTKELTTTMKKIPLPVYVFHLETLTHGFRDGGRDAHRPSRQR